MFRSLDRLRLALPPRLIGFVLLAASLQVPASAQAASPLKAVRACVARADSACVVRLLSGAKPTLAEASEHWLSLAFAQSRLGQHTEARRAFGTWLKLSPKHRLDRGQMPARIWPDYVAALLAHHGGSLDLEPRVTRTPKPAAAQGSWRDLPTFPPPPRSDRDRAKDVELVLGPELGSPLGGNGLAVSVGLLIRLKVQPTWKIGVGGTAMSTPTAAGSRDALGILGVQAEWVLTQATWGRISLAGHAGAGLAQGQNGQQRIVPTIAPGVRYAWLPKKANLGVEVSLSDRILVDGDELGQTLLLGVGLLVRPGTSKKERR